VVLWVRGKADNRQGEMQVIADEIKWEPMTEIEKKVSGKHEIRKGNAVGTDPSVCPEKNKCPGDETHPWKIQLKDGFKPSDLKRLHNVLLAHPGKCPVEIHALGQVFYPQIGVSADDALQKKVREFTG
jgi:hypothetical protein